MKTLPTMIAATLLIASAGASAEYSRSIDGQNTLVAGIAASKADAYQLGVDKLAQLKTYSPRQLSFEFVPGLPNVDHSMTRINDDSHITLQERLGANGNLGYVSRVNVKFGYSVIEKSDRE